MLLGPLIFLVLHSDQRAENLIMLDQYGFHTKRELERMTTIGNLGLSVWLPRQPGDGRRIAVDTVIASNTEARISALHHDKCPDSRIALASVTPAASLETPA